MSDLTSFLRARLNEDGRLAREMQDALWQIIDLCEGAIAAGEIKPGTTWNDDAKGAVVAEGILRLMALLYRGHPDYDTTWAPKSTVSSEQ